MEELKDIITTYETMQKKDIYLIANAVTYTEKMSCYTIKHALDNEFFSNSEFGEIVSALFKTGSYVNVFYTEMDFIKYIIENEKRLDRDNLIVYNLARDGIHEGKKSLVPAFCDLFSLQYTGSNAFVTSLCRNKAAWSAIANHYNISTPRFFQYKYKEQMVVGNYEQLLEKKIIVKNTYESASIGMDEESIFEFKNVNQIIKKAEQKKNDLLIQEYIQGFECEVPFFKIADNIIVLDPIYIDTKGSSIITSEISNAYDYSFQFLNKVLDNAVCQAIKETVKKFAMILGIDTYGRIDFRITNEQDFYMIDIAATPYTIEHSSFWYAISEYGFKYEDIYKIILYAAINKNSYVEDH